MAGSKVQGFLPLLLSQQLQQALVGRLLLQEVQAEAGDRACRTLARRTASRSGGLQHPDYCCLALSWPRC